MKNIEKYLDQLLEGTDNFMCECCNLRLGYKPCSEYSSIFKEECESNVEANKKWLKAEYVPPEVINILKLLNNKYHCICRSEYKVEIAQFKEDLNVNLRDVVDLSYVFQYKYFTFLPLDKTLLISDVIEGKFN